MLISPRGYVIYHILTTTFQQHIHRKLLFHQRGYASQSTPAYGHLREWRKKEAILNPYILALWGENMYHWNQSVSLNYAALHYDRPMVANNSGRAVSPSFGEGPKVIPMLKESTLLDTHFLLICLKRADTVLVLEGIKGANNGEQSNSYIVNLGKGFGSGL